MQQIKSCGLICESYFGKTIRILWILLNSGGTKEDWKERKTEEEKLTLDLRRFGTIKKVKFKVLCEKRQL